jgi:hypothetical protein
MVLTGIMFGDVVSLRWLPPSRPPPGDVQKKTQPTDKRQRAQNEWIRPESHTTRFYSMCAGCLFCGYFLTDPAGRRQ